MNGVARKIRILIADDHALFREAMRNLLDREPDLSVIGEAGTGQEALELAGTLKPDILLLDLLMPQFSGMEVLSRLAKQPVHLRTILLADSPDKSRIVEALKLGARGVVSKSTSTQMLLKSIRAVASGQYWIGHENVSDLVDCLRAANPKPEAQSTDRSQLTPREVDIITSIVDGYTNKQIAEKLSISEQTVKHHLTNIFAKVGVTNRLELALFAMHQRFASNP